MAFAMPERWPGDTRPLHVRALEKREEAARALKATVISEAKRAAYRKGGGAPHANHFARRHPPVELGDQFGPWTVISLMGRDGVSSRTRVVLRCTCGRRKEAYDYNARLHQGECPHPSPSVQEDES